jgi:hypothetical protein
LATFFLLSNRFLFCLCSLGIKNFYVFSLINSNNELGLYISEKKNSILNQATGIFRLGGCNNGVELPKVSQNISPFVFSHKDNLIESKHNHNKFFRASDELYIFDNGLKKILFPLSLEKKFNLSFSSNYGYFFDVFERPFFYEDKKNTFFIFPTLYQTLNQQNTYEAHEVSLFSHPHICTALRQINRKGIDGLLKPNPNGDQIDVDLSYQQVEDYQYFQQYYGSYYSTHFWEIGHYYFKEFSFRLTNGNSIYNYELFFHTPFQVACRLSENQKFKEAQKWFHYIFDPTETEGNTPARYWRTKPFHEYNNTNSIQQLMNELNQGDSDAEQQVELWRKNPFNPHLIARMRTPAYMKAVVMKYLDNLIAWGDQLFRQDSIESLSQATNIYILAAQILGRKPELVQKGNIADKSFNELEPTLDSFSNALVALENTALTNGSGGTTSGNGGIGTVPGVNVLYYCIPKNEKWLRYWETVADRLFKIRHCMNIEGVVRQLPLFQPPIDPAVLVKAAAGGVDIGAALGAMNAPLPYYRFQYMISKAFELVAEVKSLGSALLQAIEKRDAEKIALIRSEHEIGIQGSIKNMKGLAIEEAEETIGSLNISKQIVSARYKYYSSREYMNREEELQLKKMQRAIVLQTIGQGIEIMSPIMSLFPDFDLGASGISSPVIKAKFGGQNLYNAIMGAARVLSLLSAIENHGASKASIKGGYVRRKEDWMFQSTTAAMELPQIDKQIQDAKIRKMMAEKDLVTVEKQIENAKEVAAFMEDKFSNIELYDWMKKEVSNLFFQTYQMAFDLAK